MPHTLPEPVLHLQITARDDETMVHQVLIHNGRSDVLGDVPADEPPEILVPAGAGVRAILAADMLEHVLDEEAWLAACATELEPGGHLLVRVPLEGPLAWMDALNIYRYTQDITGWGERLLETQTKGWHRHYRLSDMTALLDDAGFTIDRMVRHGSPTHDIVHFGHLVWGKLLRNEDAAEFRAMARREEAESGFDLPRLGPFSTKLSVWATRRP